MTDLLAIALLTAGLALGIWFGMLWGAVRARASSASEQAQAIDRATRAESALGEVRLRYEDGKKLEVGLRESLALAEGKRIQAETQLQETIKSLEEQKTLLAAAKTELATAFKALADDALKGNNQAFLELAKTAFAAVQAEAKGDLAQRQQAIQGLISPLQVALTRYEEQIAVMEKARQFAYGGLDEHLKTLAQSHDRLQRETGNLVKALRAPQVRGRWGEITLKRVAELAGMVDHCDFVEQESTEGETGRLRPDMIIQLPGGRRIVVDAKAVLSAYLEAVEAQDDAVRLEGFRQHAAQVRARLLQLAGKAYWTQFTTAPEFVVLFLPGEQFLGAALENDRTLIEDGFAKRVIIASPTTLIALLRAVAYGWRQEQLTENAQAISALGKDLFERMATLVGHFADVGSALGKGVDAYNRTVASMESRVLPTVRKFKDLGISSEKDVVKLDTLDQAARPVPEVVD